MSLNSRGEVSQQSEFLILTIKIKDFWLNPYVDDEELKVLKIFFTFWIDVLFDFVGLLCFIVEYTRRVLKFVMQMGVDSGVE